MPYNSASSCLLTPPSHAPLLSAAAVSYLLLSGEKNKAEFGYSDDQWSGVIHSSLVSATIGSESAFRILNRNLSSPSTSLPSSMTSSTTAWHLCDPDAEKVFQALRKAGVKVAVVSTFDTRLRHVLRALNCDKWFDVVAISAEVDVEKPNPMIFLKACELLGVNPIYIMQHSKRKLAQQRRKELYAHRKGKKLRN